MEWTYFKVAEQAKISRIYSIFERSFKPDYNFVGELHNFWECVYVESGSICVTADERVLELTASEIIFHKPLELHKFFVDCPTGATLFIFSFSLEGALYKKISDKVCRLNHHQEQIMQSFLGYLRAAAVQNGLVAYNDITDFYRLLKVDELLAQMVSTYIIQLIISVSNDISNRSTSTAPDAKLFGRAVDYMREHIGEPLSVTELAQFVGVSRSGIQRIFDKYAKMGVNKYFISLKIRTATNLLEEGTGVGQTAALLGYSSQSYFSAAYKRETGQNLSDIISRARHT